MQEASSFSSLEHGISFARDLWFNNSSIRAWLDAFSAHRHIGLSQEEFQEETEDLGEIVPDSLEEELMPSNSSDEVFWTGDKATMRSYDLNKTPDENQIE
ncbi:hypothetical protein AHAS_Ahas04G0164400 [Arachis hypogaea]